MAQGNGTTQTQGGTSGGNTDDQNKNGGTTTQQQQQGDQNKQGKDGGDKGQQLTYDSLIARLTDDEKAVLTEHTKGLRSALGSEREAKGKLERDLRDLSKQLEGNKDAQAKVDALANDVGKERLRGDFYEEAHNQGVDNLKLAFMAAQQDGLIDDRGRVNWAQLKKDYPQLYRQEPEPKVQIKGNGGEGSRNAGQQRQPSSMTDWIRTGEQPTIG